MEDKARLERLVEAEASKPRWKRRVDSVRCLKGIDVMSAADLVFEAGEFSRFKNARSFAAWIGLTPSEHSSGVSATVKSTISTNVNRPFAPLYTRQSRHRILTNSTTARGPMLEPSRSGSFGRSRPWATT